VAATDWGFNAWARYSNWRHDDRVPARLAERLGMRRFPGVISNGGHPRRLVLEGGSIDVDGAGHLLTTEECLLSPIQARNPGVDRASLSGAFEKHLGVRRVLWLGRGIAGDDTHGHVDDIARFVNPEVIVAAVEPNRRDDNHRPLARNLTRLKRMRTLRGTPFEIVTLPMPRPLFFGSLRLPASYLNFYIGNRVVLVPTFNDPSDRVALSTLAEIFADREVVGIHAVDLVLGLGTIHCLTQQEPAAEV
jgi:agmatine deiminase